MIYFFGDVHFSSMNPWNNAAGENFISWFKERFKDENKTNYAIFLGDVSDKDTNPGDVVDQMFRLFSFCSEHFKKTDILMGNHDLKLFRGHTVQTALKFLNNFKNVEVIDDICGIERDGKHILCLPHKRVSCGDINKYYSEYDWENDVYAAADYQLAIGHWAIQNKDDIRFRNGVDISKIPVDKEHSPMPRGVLCGHIHNRPTNEYIGSIWPLNAEEQKCKYPRCFIKWSDNWEEEPLPEFMKFETITYGVEVPKHQDIPVVYTIEDAPSEGDVNRTYPDIFIRGIKQNKKNDEKSSTTEQIDLTLNDDPLDLFNEMVKEQNLTITRGALKVVRELLKKD